MKKGSGRGGRRGGGCRKSPLPLRDHIDRCINMYSNVQEIVDHIRTTVPQYRRWQLQPLTKEVQDAVELINFENHGSTRRGDPSTSNRSLFDGDSNETPDRKKQRRRDADEARLQELEERHLRRKQIGTNQDDSNGDSQSGETDDSVSTSEDDVYGEKVEPEFDLMKSMLRETYSDRKPTKKPNKKSDYDKKRKNVELDTKSTKKKVDVLAGGHRGSGKKDVENGSVAGGDTVDEVKGKDGPRFKDLGGMGGVLEKLKMEIIVPLYHPQLPKWLGVRPMAGILLHGPPGCGKTKLAHAIANETGVPFYKISATELVSGVSGASEENIRDLFAKAHRTAPSIVFIDEIDAIASKRENAQREMERRIVTQLMTCMDELHNIVHPTDDDQNTESSSSTPGYVLVIGATNRPDAVDSALRRPGRFDWEITLGVPDESARIEILSVLTRNLRVEGAFDLVKLARSTPGFVGADLNSLANKAGNLAMKRIIDRRKTELSREPADGNDIEDWWRHPWLPEEMENLSITMSDFEEAAKLVQPSLRREGFSAIPNVKWDNVGGLHLLRQEFDRYIVRRIKYPEDYEGFGVDLETGFLLYGPPGCGKTLIAKAVANEAGANFIHIKGPELLNKYVGESELAVRTIFSRARTCSPCILFFDEVDALTTKRGNEGGWVVERLLNQLLIELDGSDDRRGVYVIGATNRPEVMDRAVLRPGRFGKLMYVPLPSPEERGLILKAISHKKPIDQGVDLFAIGAGEACANLSGADLSALMNEAAMIALEEKLTAAGVSSDDASTWTIKQIHFEQALKKISPSVSDKQIQYYKVLSDSFTAA